jgi:hypothetical protein
LQNGMGDVDGHTKEAQQSLPRNGGGRKGSNGAMALAAAAGAFAPAACARREPAAPAARAGVAPRSGGGVPGSCVCSLRARGRPAAPFGSRQMTFKRGSALLSGCARARARKCARVREALRAAGGCQEWLAGPRARRGLARKQAPGRGVARAPLAQISRRAGTWQSCMQRSNWGAGAAPLGRRRRSGMPGRRA